MIPHGMPSAARLPKGKKIRVPDLSGLELSREKPVTSGYNSIRWRCHMGSCFFEERERAGVLSGSNSGSAMNMEIWDMKKQL
jgi:hypothetical protein